MEIEFMPLAVEHLDYWKKSGKKNIQKKIQQLLLSIKESPFEGIGKPEPLKHELTGSWSRRINQEHRIVYEVKENVIEIQRLKGHY
ncbi:MAG: toxin YoeB [Bacteroidota bacterium]|jgi:toxin YoeB|nr:toxin YoeB [Bacteroidota bacterium]